MHPLLDILTSAKTPGGQTRNEAERTSAYIGRDANPDRTDRRPAVTCGGMYRHVGRELILALSPSARKSQKNYSHAMTISIITIIRCLADRRYEVHNAPTLLMIIVALPMICHRKALGKPRARSSMLRPNLDARLSLDLLVLI